MPLSRAGASVARIVPRPAGRYEIGVAENFNKRLLDLVEEMEQSFEDIGTEVTVLTSIVKDLEGRLSALERDREAS